MLLHAARWFDGRPWFVDRPGFLDRPWWAFVGWFLPLLVLAGPVALAVWLVLRAGGRPTAPPPPAAPARDPALEQVRMRYARGEIDRETFLQLSRDLGGEPPAGG